MQTQTDTYPAPDLSAALAATVQAVETALEDGFTETTIVLSRDSDEPDVHITYQREDA